jgi:NADPH:quinone reductase-like Zn-dependent oxidoreductase
VQVQRGQTILVTGALGGVGRAAVHSAGKLGAGVIAGVRANQVAEASTLHVSGVLAIDDDGAVASLPHVDGVADTVGGATAAKLLDRVKDGGRFGYASVLPEGMAQRYPAVTIARVFAKPDPSKVREFADDLRDGKFVLPIGRRLPLQQAAEAHRLGEAGGSGKIILLCR